MEISEVRIKLVEDSSERLRAFCSITLDGDFVIRDLKIIDGVSGPFVAMPSRKLADRCPRCGCKNHLRAKYCNDCGLKLNENRAPKDAMGRAKLHADVAHPINAACRERIQAAVVKAYEAELERSKTPGYKPPVYDDFGDDDITHLIEEQAGSAYPPAARTAEPAAAATPPEADAPDEEESVVSANRDEEDAFSDYNSLIADLRREAAGRHGRPEREGSTFSPVPRPVQPRGERGPGRGGERGPRGGGRHEREGRRGDRGGRGDDRGRRGDRRGGPREERRRDEPRRQESYPEAGPATPPPMEAPSAPKPVAPPPPSDEEDDFSAGL
jgi:stage V sporulation protein G